MRALHARHRLHEPDLPMTAIAEWKRPRVGQHIKLRDGKEAEVLVVRGCNQVLKLLPELKAMSLGSNLKATYGKNWQTIYFEADVIVKVKKVRLMKTVTPNDILELLDKWL